LTKPYEKIDQLFSWTMDLETNITFISPKVKDILGYEPGEMTYKNLTQFLNGEDAEGLTRKIHSFNNNNISIWTIRLNFQTKFNKLVMLEITGIACYQKDKDLAGYEGIAYEV
jgi:PAS domain S-box-containing protein